MGKHVNVSIANLAECAAIAVGEEAVVERTATSALGARGGGRRRPVCEWAGPSMHAVPPGAFGRDRDPVEGAAHSGRSTERGASAGTLLTHLLQRGADAIPERVARREEHRAQLIRRRLAPAPGSCERSATMIGVPVHGVEGHRDHNRQVVLRARITTGHVNTGLAKERLQEIRRAPLVTHAEVELDQAWLCCLQRAREAQGVRDVRGGVMGGPARSRSRAPGPRGGSCGGPRFRARPCRQV